MLGAGWIAEKYLEAIRDNPRTVVAGVRSRTPGKATALLAQCGLSAREYRSDDELFTDDDVDIVVSCTPPDVRCEHVVRAAESGRHVIMEKPLGLTVDEVREMHDAISRARIRSIASFVLRWNPQLETLKKLVDDCFVGDLLYAEADYWNALPAMYHDSWLLSRSIGGSAFVAAGCHAVDAIRWLAGDIVSVCARGAPPRMLAAFEYEPVVVATVTFANGAVGKVSTVLEGDTPHIFNVRLFGTGGSIQNNQIYSSARYPGARDYLEVPTTPPDRPEGQHPYAAQLEHFVECIDTGRDSHASIYDTWKSMAVCFAIDRSLANGSVDVAVDRCL